MKLNPISEELEWRLFEWVEGNLTPEESAELETIISQDANLQNHVAALKATQIGNEFSDLLDDQTKSSLKHYSIKTTSIPTAETHSFQRIWKIAATIVVLMISTVVYQQNHPKTNGNVAKQRLSPENKIYQNPRLQQQINGEANTSTAIKSPNYQAFNSKTDIITKQQATPLSKITTVEHPLIIATTLPIYGQQTNTEKIAIPQINPAIKTINNEANTPKIEEETIVMMSPTAKSNPKEFAKMAWGNMKEMMRQGKLPKIIISPIKNEENQRIPDVNFGIQMNQMSFVKTVSYNPTHN